MALENAPFTLHSQFDQIVITKITLGNQVFASRVSQLIEDNFNVLIPKMAFILLYHVKVYTHRHNVLTFLRNF